MIFVLKNLHQASFEPTRQAAAIGKHHILPIVLCGARSARPYSKITSMCIHWFQPLLEEAIIHVVVWEKKDTSLKKRRRFHGVRTRGACMTGEAVMRLPKGSEQVAITFSAHV